VCILVMQRLDVIVFHKVIKHPLSKKKSICLDRTIKNATSLHKPELK
jgi:hypothetical protein